MASHRTTSFLLAALASVGCVAPRGKMIPTATQPLATSQAEVASRDATLKIWVRGGDAHSEVLVLINGGPGLSHESMEPLQDALASPTLRVVTYDQRGVGASTARGAGKLTPRDHLDDLDAIRTFFGRDRIHLLGHSFGGMIALSYLDRQPENVASLVLVSPGVSNAEAMQKGGERLFQRVALLQRDGIIPPTMPTSCRERILAMMPAYFADPRMPIPEVLKDRHCESERSSILSEMIDLPYEHGVGSAKVPALVVYGEREPFGSAPALAAAAALGPAAPKVVALKDCGHLGWLECRDAFYQAVAPFVRAQTQPK